MERLLYDDDTAFSLADDAATVARIARMATRDELRAARFADWSALEVIGHVADIGEVFAERVRRIAYEERPALPSVDQDAIAAERRNHEGDPVALAKRIQAAHGEIVRLLAEPANRVRTGIHAELGEIDGAYVGAYHARHAHGHIADLAARFPPRA